MKIVCSPKGIVDKDRPRQGIMDIADAGFLDQGVICGLSEDETDVWGDAACEYRIVEPIVEDVEKDALWTVNREYYLSLLDEARTHNVKILLKNMCRNVGGHLIRGVCSDAAEAVAWVDALNTEAGEARFGFCVDMGVCNVCGQDLNEYITPLGNRVKAVILQDGNGSEAQALLPFTAAYKKTLRTDWLGLIRGLRKIGFDGILILNLEDTVSATSPLLRPALLRYAKQVADYLCWQIGIETTLARYESRVLFFRQQKRSWGKNPYVTSIFASKEMEISRSCNKSRRLSAPLRAQCQLFGYYRSREREMTIRWTSLVPS